MQLSLEGLDQRFDISSPSVFIQRVQILMREVMIAYWQLAFQSSAALTYCWRSKRCIDYNRNLLYEWFSDQMYF